LEILNQTLLVLRIPITHMKTPITVFLFAMVSAATLPAAVTITVSNFSPNGSASGGSGSGTGAFTLAINGGTATNISTIAYPAATNRGLPVTTYTISDIDLTSVGGTATESFTFTVAYSQTGGTAVQFNGFGNVSVTGGDNNQVDTSETLTATIALTGSSFAEFSLIGFTEARGGGVAGADQGTFSHAGGTANISASTPGVAVTGTTVTLGVSTGAINFEGFRANFVAVPEPGSLSLLGLGSLALLRRRRL
jgi:hypothetical protein